MSIERDPVVGQDDIQQVFLERELCRRVVVAVVVSLEFYDGPRHISALS